MVSEVFNFLCSAFIILCLVEIASLLFVSVHETFRKKREELRSGSRSAAKTQNDMAGGRRGQTLPPVLIRR